MKKKKHTSPRRATERAEPSDIHQDVEDLLGEILLEEATQVVWQKFEKSLNQFDDTQLDLFEQYLDGVPISELSRQQNVSAEQLTAWIKKLKKEMIQALREETSVRQ